MQPDGWRIDVPAARDLIAREKPPLVVLGRSLFLFPEPVQELREVCRESGTLLFYDGAHVLGLIAGGAFQDPLHEGADLMAGSTHKTYFGPQRGVVLSSHAEGDMNQKLDRGVFPGSTSNHHLFTLPALLVATLEVERFGAEYARAVVANARAFGAALARKGITVGAADLGYTASHQVAIDVGEHGGGKAVSRRLAEQDVVCNMNMLPGEPPKSALDPRGIRLGVQEMTRFGMGPAEMEEIADLFHAAVVRSRDVRDEVHALRARFPAVRYGFARSDLGL
jgi:glycine hydroxymethyltransferase